MSATVLFVLLVQSFLATPERHALQTSKRLGQNRFSAILQIGDESTVSLLSQFNLGLTLQRAGDPEGALEAYEVFISAAEESGTPTKTFVEALTNVGIIQAQQRNRAGARTSFERALAHRPMGSAHVNLALVCLAEGSAAAADNGQKGFMPLGAIQEATTHCKAAIELNDDPNSVKTAERLLGDMMRRA